MDTIRIPEWRPMHFNCRVYHIKRVGAHTALHDGGYRNIRHALLYNPPPSLLPPPSTSLTSWLGAREYVWRSCSTVQLFTCLALPRLALAAFIERIPLKMCVGLFLRALNEWASALLHHWFFHLVQPRPNRSDFKNFSFSFNHVPKQGNGGNWQGRAYRQKQADANPSLRLDGRSVGRSVGRMVGTQEIRDERPIERTSCA